jgi:hypothetical protein
MPLIALGSPSYRLGMMVGVMINQIRNFSDARRESSFKEDNRYAGAEWLQLEVFITREGAPNGHRILRIAVRQNGSWVWTAPPLAG